MIFLIAAWVFSLIFGKYMSLILYTFFFLTRTHALSYSSSWLYISSRWDFVFSILCLFPKRNHFKINHSALSESFCCLPVRLLLMYLISGFVHSISLLYLCIFLFYVNAHCSCCHMLLSSSIICIAGTTGRERSHWCKPGLPG